MTTIQSVLHCMSFSDFVEIAEQAERERRANERLTAIHAAEAKANQERWNRQRILDLNRPEYLYAKNAELKERKYKRWINTNCVSRLKSRSVSQNS